jgi:hypothetical protein
MARTRFLDYRAEDSTELFNNTLRGILEAGVVLGFNISVGSGGGWWLKFTHDADPDNTGSVLGVLITHDGVIIQENADQDNVVAGVAPGGADEIHYVVASYTYNKALPNNDVVYVVKTAVAPATPTLTDDEVLLGVISVPTGSGSYSATGVDIRTVAKLSVYDINEYNFWSKLEDVLDPGIYDGFEMSEGSTQLKVDLSAGVFLTQESVKIVETSDQADLFTLSAVSDGYYRFVWVLGMHKKEDTDPLPSVDYLLVEGTEALLGAAATLPSDSTILTAAQAVNAKYDDASYINKLGYIRIQNVSGTYTIDYYKGTTVLDAETRIVYGAEADTLQRSGHYYGHQGLVQAIADIYAVSSTRETIKKPYTIILDGEFKLAGATLHLPSHIRLAGNGAPAILRSDVSDVVAAEGFYADYNGSNNTVAQSTPGLPARSGYVDRQFEVQVTYQVGADLQTKMFSRGDTILAYSTSNAAFYSGTIYEVISTWRVNVYMETQYNTDGNPLDLDLMFLKNDIQIDNVAIVPISSSAAGGFVTKYIEDCVFDRIVAKKYVHRYQRRCAYGFVTILGSFDWDGSTDLGSSRDNVYQRILANGPGASSLGVYEERAKVGEVTFQASSAITFTLAWSFAEIGKVSFSGATGCTVDITGEQNTIRQVYAETGTLKFNASKNVVLASRCDTLQFASGTGNAVVYSGHSTVSDLASSPTNRIFTNVGSSSDQNNAIEGLNEDRNLRAVSDANISWNAVTGLLEWDNAILFDIPWKTGYTQIDAGNATLSTSGDRLWIDVDRDASGTSVVATSVRAKSGATNDRFYKDRVNVAIRYNDVVYLWDGTRIEDGQVLKLGQTPPPLGSVSYDRLADSALAFHNKVFRDYVEQENNDLWENKIVFHNSGSVTFTYTTATGVIQYASSVNLSEVKPGDFLMVRDANYDPSDSYNRSYSFEEILEVNDGSNWVRIAPGLNVPVSVGHPWNGSIGRGNKVFTNKALYSYTYIHYGVNYGRVTFAADTGFGPYQVRPGYVFVDAAGQKFQIIERDTSGNGRWIRIIVGSRRIDTTTPITNENQGSVELNNNPYDIPVDSCKCVFGSEFIPIDRAGQVDHADDSLVRHNKATETLADIVARSKCFANPYDPRIRVWATRHGERGGFWENSYINPTFYPEDLDSLVIDFTGVCTGALLAFRSNAGFVSRYLYTRTALWVDGELVDGPYQHADPETDLVYSDAFNRNAIAFDSEYNRYGYLTGSNGQTSIGSYSFDDTVTPAAFQSVDVKPGDVLHIITGADAGYYTIDAIPTETRLTLQTPMTATASGLSYQLFQYGAQRVSRVLRLPQGIHNIRWKIKQPFLMESGLLNMVSGIYVLNSPYRTDKALMASDLPGTAVMKGGVREFVYQLERTTGQTTVPTSSENWDKGGRIVRYVSKDGSHQWATRFIRGFTDSGTVAGGSPLIQNVTNIGQWRIGDMILMVNATDYQISYVTNISGTTLTMSLNVPGGWSGVKTLYFYGTCLRGDGAAPYPTNAADRSTEEVAATYRLLDFVGPGGLDFNKTLARRVAQDVNVFGMRLNDMTTGVSGVSEAPLMTTSFGISTIVGLRLETTPGDEFLRIVFVGTGLSLNYWSLYDSTNPVISITIDGMSAGNVLFTQNTKSAQAYPEADIHGVFICGELPYGTHVVELRCTGAAGTAGYFAITGFTVFQPKQPQIPDENLPALPLVDTNLVAGRRDSVFGIGTKNTVQRSQVGVINYDAASVISTTSWSAFEDDDENASNFGTFCDRFLKIGTTSSQNEAYIIPFFGDEITLVTNDIAVNSDSISIYFLDSDGVFRPPSLLGGFSVTGVDAITADVTTDGYRIRWLMSRLGFHVMKVVFNVDNQQMQIDSVEIGTPYHTHNSKMPITTDHMLPYQGGKDIRNMVPFDSSLLPDTPIVSLHGYMTENDSLASPDSQDPFIFYTRGGMVTVECQFTGYWLGDSGDEAIGMHIDGIPVDPTDNRNYIRHYTAASSQFCNIVAKMTVYLSEGFHYAYMRMDNINHLIRNANWSAVSVEPSEALASRRNGRGKPAVGIVGPRGSY